MTIFTNSIRRIFANPVNLIFMLIVPIVLNVTVIATVMQPARYSVSIVSEENTPTVQAIIDEIAKDCAVKSVGNLEEGKQEMVNNTIDCIIMIPKGYTQDVLAGTGKVDLYFRPSDDMTVPLQREFKTLFYDVNVIGTKSGGSQATFSGDLKDYLSGSFAVNYKYTTVVSSVAIERAISALGYLAVGMLFFITFSTMLIFKDRECGVFSRISASPLGRMSYFFQNLLSFLFVAVLQVIIMFLIIPCFVDISFGETIGQLFTVMLITLLFAACCIGIGVLVSSLSPNVLVANTITSLINVPMLMLGGCFWPSSYMPVGLQMIGACIPTGWFLHAAKCIISGEDVGNAIFFAALLVTLTVATLVVAYVFSFSELAARRGLSKMKVAATKEGRR